MHLPLCLCAELPRIETKTRVLLVPHAAEWERPSSTGRIAVLALASAELALWRADIDPTPLLPVGHERWVLHPSGAPIAPSDRPVTLIVPDGTWRESSRIARRLFSVPGTRVVRVDSMPRAGLRRAPDASRIGTCDAIACALEALGEREEADRLRAALRLMIDRTLWQRGKLASELVSGGMPIEVRRAMSNPRGVR